MALLEDKLHWCLGQHWLAESSLKALKNAVEINITLRGEQRSSVDILRQNALASLITNFGERQRHLAVLSLPVVNQPIVFSNIVNNATRSITDRQRELVTMEEETCRHTAVIDLAVSALEELKGCLRLLSKSPSEKEKYRMAQTGLPQVAAYVKLLAVQKCLPISESWVPFILAGNAASMPFQKLQELPSELRRLVWIAALPGPRIVTNDARENQSLDFLSTCSDLRGWAKRHYTQLLSPVVFPGRIDTNILYVNLERDTVVRDVDWTFNSSSGFDPAIKRALIGLTEVRQLAVSFNLCERDGRKLFEHLRACCPDLQRVIFFPISGRKKMWMTRWHPRTSKVHFVDIDSNVVDYMHFRVDKLVPYDLKITAGASMELIEGLQIIAQCYRQIFPWFVNRSTWHGMNWNPKIRVCVMLKWDPIRQDWDAQQLPGDKYLKRLDWGLKPIPTGFMG